ncbi:branched-chain amino acid ABC transporter permease [Rhodococcus triatomae]
MDGVAIGVIYGLVGLALLMVYRSTGVLNFAQGEMAVFCTYIAWTLIVSLGVSLWLGFAATVAFAFVLGVLVERLVIRPAGSSHPLAVMIVTIGLFMVFNSFQRDWWPAGPKAFPSPFPAGTVDIGSARISAVSIGILIAAALVMLCLTFLFRMTRIGLAMRAVVDNPTASSLMGIGNHRIVSLGWGLASAVGAVAGMLAVNLLLLDPSTAYALLLFSFAALVLAGMTSPVGVVVCGVLLGLFNALASGFSIVGTELSIVVTLLALVVVLVVKPGGLFGKAPVIKV